MEKERAGREGEEKKRGKEGEEGRGRRRGKVKEENESEKTGIDSNMQVYTCGNIVYIVHVPVADRVGFKCSIWSHAEKVVR